MLNISLWTSVYHLGVVSLVPTSKDSQTAWPTSLSGGRGKKPNNDLDDFLFTALIKALCDGLVDTFFDLCKTINFPVSVDKTVWGCQVIVFLGMLINTVTQTISIPMEKCQKAVQLLTSTLESKNTTVLKLQ